MCPVDDFTLFDSTTAEPVVGTYMWPMRVFGPDTRKMIEEVKAELKEDRVHPKSLEPRSLTKIIRTIAIGSHEIFITQQGGLFARPSEELAGPYADSEPFQKKFQEKMEFQENLSGAFNRLLCELALLGVVSDPVSPVHISGGLMGEGYALVTVGGGSYLERTVAPTLAQRSGEWQLWTRYDEALLDRAAAQTCTGRLIDISPSVPTLIVGAYSLFARRLLSEALIDGWIVTEQLIDHLWQRHISPVKDKARRERLEDDRSYPASIRVEMLLTAGVIDGQMAEATQVARQHRNRLAHRAKISLQATTECLDAMRGMVEFICGEKVAPPPRSFFIGW